jgi:radical SAM protein with 4Fe4S-binding SPASM domain
MRTRAEPFGAWVRVDDATLVAVSRRAAGRLGVDGGELWRGDAPSPSRAPARAPLEAHVAVTARCPAGCSGCYLDARPDGEAPSYDVLAARLEAIAASGVFTVAFGGGEPLTRPDLGDLATHARTLGLVPVVTTSGIGLTAERAARLRAFAQVNVSYDGDGAVYESVRGFDGASIAERAMRHLREAGVPFGVNVVLTRSSFDALHETLARAHVLGAREAQLLRYKPAGRAASLDYLARRLSPEQVDRLRPELERIARLVPISLRVDCALVPLLAAPDLDVATLLRFGVFGCEAGRHLSAVTVAGAISACSFASPSSIDVAAIERHFSDDPHLARWRELPDDEPCRSCSLREVCRGGCRVVAAHLDAGASSRSRPDPECPRVRAHREHVAAE